MPKRLNLPDTASIAQPGPDGRLLAPSAARNVEAIVATVGKYVPAKGRALEIASGTGQHIVRYGAEFPNVIWQPTDIDPDRIESIRKWVGETDCTNLLDPVILDATVAGWSSQHNGFDLIILVNLLHLISAAEARILIDEAAEALAPRGRFIAYGPFMRGESFASEGDQKFHASLVSQDPEIGYKSFEHIQNLQSDAGLIPDPKIEMPASNLILAAQKGSK